MAVVAGEQKVEVKHIVSGVRTKQGIWGKKIEVYMYIRRKSLCGLIRKRVHKHPGFFHVSVDAPSFYALLVHWKNDK